METLTFTRIVLHVHSVRVKKGVVSDGDPPLVKPSHCTGLRYGCYTQDSLYIVKPVHTIQDTLTENSFLLVSSFTSLEAR